MRVVLVTTPLRVYKPNVLPQVGMMSLAGYLESLGHEVHIVDAALQREPRERVARRVVDLRPDLVGVGGLVTAYEYVIGLSHEIKSLNENIPIVLGGTILINNVKNCFEHMKIDYGIHGYGEIALGKLVDHIAGTLPREEIPGLSYREGGEIVTNPGREFFKKIDDMPLPAYHLVDMDYYVKSVVEAVPILRDDIPKNVLDDPKCMIVMGTLGCTDKCTFCVHEQEFVGLKRHSNEYIIENLKYLRDHYGVNYFMMGEEMFISGLHAARQFNALMKEHLPDCCWAATTRADGVTPEMIEELKTGNCVGLHWGYEAGSQKMLDLMQKRISVEVNERAYRESLENGLMGSLSFMVGNVGETNQTVKETIESIHRAGIAEGTVFYVSAYPGGRVWDWAIEKNIIEDTHRYLIEVSDVDPANKININLTPYPHWVLRAWSRMVRRALFEEALDKLDEIPPEVRRGPVGAIRAFMTRTVLPAVIDVYFAARAVRRKIFTTAKDRQYAFNVDATGALLPDNLIVAKPQRFQPPEKLVQLAQEPRERVELETVR